MIAIVGHGPSVKEKGEEIDSCEKVVRLKGYKLNSDFGFKVDAICASTEIMGTFFKSDAPECWAYPKNGFYNSDFVMRAIEEVQKPVLVPTKFINHWNERFRKLGSKHPCFSTGMAAILISIHRFNPKKIKLFGFDTLLDPSKEFCRHPDVPRSGFGPYPNHDWEKENELLEIIKKQYGIEIC